jgi:hypothetical protein
MGKVALRSFFCGLAGAVVMIAWLSLTTSRMPAAKSGGGVVGVGVLTMWHSMGWSAGVWMLAGFAIGFLLGWQKFSKGRPSQAV